MTRRRRLMIVCVATVLMSGCNEAVAPVDTLQGSRTSGEPTESDLAKMPPEFRLPTAILRHDVSGSFQPGFALAQSIVRYVATHASITLTLQLFAKDTPVGGDVVAVERRSSLLPIRNEFSAMATAGVTRDCGYRMNIKSFVEIENQFPLDPTKLLKWGGQGETKTHQLPQGECLCEGSGGYTGENGQMATSILPAGVRVQCSEPDGTTGGTYSGGGGSAGGGSGGSWAQVTTTTCSGTHYFDENGKYVHTHIHSCESSSSYIWISAA